MFSLLFWNWVFPFIFESLSCFPSLSVHWIYINMTWERDTLSLWESHIKRLKSENSALNRQLTWLDMIWFLPILCLWWMDLKWKTEVFLIKSTKGIHKCQKLPNTSVPMTISIITPFTKIFIDIRKFDT